MILQTEQQNVAQVLGPSHPHGELASAFEAILGVKREIQDPLLYVFFPLYNCALQRIIFFKKIEAEKSKKVSFIFIFLKNENHSYSKGRLYITW